ncbi:TonB-dependent siderophore receptor [Thalassolituus oleivorans]|jgi:iron complex outermembrane receptor protein|uniref:Putative TonB-dependent receptor n=1 Tax=Thalassolituus oleivorans MIL-1 TaxID=1298593 RepID=M5DUX5_9GAMM|nr:TonB-dependent receptor [Thalassolituus oleivorans]PHQ88271.1 MAG: TonB-dependent receptor [Thalassobium sp.]CCU73681.1 putative TonB-dependent receptor [Thalassolituus oleivorans MIL-1]
MTDEKSFRLNKLALVIGLAFAAPALVSAAEEDVVELETYTAESTVEDTMGIMPTEPVKSVFGFNKTILETPRGVTSVSASMLDSYAITDIDDLVLISPGAFTQSFFGVAGSLDVRGTPGEVYFRGVRRVNNPGNYPTPIGASDRIDIVRGPASPIYGPSKIGGYLNFEPKSARAETGQYLEEPMGEIGITKGTWDKNVLTAEVGGPGEIAGKKLGYYVYAESENSGSYYDNSATDQSIYQASFNMDLTDKTRVEFGGMYQDFDGNQVAGWNRLTQDLIDNGTYITGTAQSVDTNGDGLNSPDEFDAWSGTAANNFFVPGSAATDADMDPAWALENVGTAKLKGNQTLVAPDDVLRTKVSTLYFDTIHDFSDTSSVTNKLFYEKLENINENAYGFSQFVDSYAIEDQVIFAFSMDHGDSIKANYQISPSVRYTSFIQGDDFDYEYFDRRDLTGPSTALDAKQLATRTDSDYAGYKEGEYTDIGLAFLADYTFAERLNLLLGARYDYFDMKSKDIAEKLHDGSGATSADDSDSATSWTASLSYTLPIGVTPYITASKQATMVIGQGSEISPDLIESGDAIADSTLKEVGIKASLFDDRLYLSSAYFTQERTNYSAQDQVSNNTTKSEGFEGEFRFLATEKLTLTGAFTHLEVFNLTAEENGTQFGFLGAEDTTGVSDPSLYYGYVLKGLNLVANEEESKKAGIPENMYSLTAMYAITDKFNITGSAVHADSTYSGFSKSVELPSYTVFNAGVKYSVADWNFGLQGKNLTDERYFRANFPDLFGATIVLPELPRHFIASASVKF